jgi:23S rRNA (cytosine1962-C5)-methyltransferase
MNEPARIILRSGKEQSLKRYHPWVFSGAIKKIHGAPGEGDVVDVYSNRDEFLGTGHYQDGSIAVRILSFRQERLDVAFYGTRIRTAVSAREVLGLPDDRQTNVCRLVNAEGDGLPGLIIDYYDGTAVMQFHSIGMHLHREWLLKGLQEALGERLRAVYDKSASTLPSRYAGDHRDDYLMGSPDTDTAPVKENGNLFSVDWEKGQKTGFFIDQRENRRLFGEYAPGRKVLNLFGYTGGFSVYARQGGAKLVHTVDSSAHAIEMANRNMRLNFGDKGRHEGIVDDAFDFLARGREAYDLMVIDPPAFAKHHHVLDHALQGYKRLNARALEKVRDGGIIFTFSCSQAVSREHFRKSVFVAAANTGRRVRILHQLTQPADHPVSIYHPEGEYLKGLVLMVD